MAAVVPKPPRPKKEPQPLVIPKNAAEDQRLKLDRLMKNVDKPVPIPDGPKEWVLRPPPEFVRDVMGSSAGAGSGEFHVYRHLRRREYQRQEYLDKLTEKKALDEDFQKKLKENKVMAEQRTAKRRKKRQKMKEKKQMTKKAKAEQKSKDENSDEASSEEPSEEEPEDNEIDDVDCGEHDGGDDDAERPSFVMGGR
ncbi:PRKR-interacting protein 1 [Protopterus annectens]|uniref:PRKR-interacting protein 1 n=1 Tax=Protopterus annectens TaxID=7888 RepID=UPI001CFBFE65|nr:PRKR-interacting protein 1 [Protopterus annectens]